MAPGIVPVRKRGMAIKHAVMIGLKLRQHSVECQLACRHPAVEVRVIETDLLGEPVPPFPLGRIAAVLTIRVAYHVRRAWDLVDWRICIVLGSQVDNEPLCVVEYVAIKIRRDWRNWCLCGLQDF